MQGYSSNPQKQSLYNNSQSNPQSQPHAYSANNTPYSNQYNSHGNNNVNNNVNNNNTNQSPQEQGFVSMSSPQNLYGPRSQPNSTNPSYPSSNPSNPYAPSTLNKSDPHRYAPLLSHFSFLIFLPFTHVPQSIPW